MLKNWCFWTVVLEKTLESPLESKEIKPVHPKGNQPWIFIRRTDAEAEAPILWPPVEKSWLSRKDRDDGKDWGQEEKGMTENEMAGRHHWLNGHEFEQAPGVGDEQGGLAYCSPWGRKESDTTERLNNSNISRGWNVQDSKATAEWFLNLDYKIWLRSSYKVTDIENKLVVTKRERTGGRLSWKIGIDINTLLLFSHSVVSDSLWPQELQLTRLPCPSLSPGVYSNPCPLSQWCHPTISSSVVPFSSHLQSFPASGSFLSWHFASGGQNIEASASVLPMSIQCWLPLGLTGLISLQSKGLSRVFFNTKVQKHQFFSAQPSLWSISYIHTWHGKTIALTRQTFVCKVVSAF